MTGAPANPYRVYEDETLIFSQANGNAITIADHGPLLVTLTLSIADGALKLADTSGLATFSGDNSKEVSLTGTSAAIAAALEGLAYTGAQDANGARTLTVDVREPASGNLIVNGGAEAGPSDDYYDPQPPQGWTRTLGDLTVVTYAPGGAGDLDLADSAKVGGGDDYFHGGEGGTASVLQQIDLSQWADEIDAGTLGASISGWFGGSMHQSDAMTMIVRFVSANGWQIGSSSIIGGFDAADRQYATGLLMDALVAEIPAGARFAEVTLSAQGQGGTIDAYADNLSFVLVDRQIEALPIEIVATPEWVYGTANDDVMHGTAGIDLLDGAAGNDLIYGGGGGDRLSGGYGNDRLSSNSGNTVFNGGEGEDMASLSRTDFSDDYTLDLGEDGSGTASDGSAFIGIERLTFWGGQGRSSVVGGIGADYLIGGRKADYLSGGSGDDELVGGDGNDILLGGEGNDRLSGRSGTVLFDGGAGHDRAEIDMRHTVGTNILGDSGADGVTYTLSDGTSVTGIEQLTYTGGSGIDRVQAGAYVDTLFGGLGDDDLHGGAGGDDLFGGGGNDVLGGGEGADDLHGEEGDDRLDGGAGADDLEGGTGNDLYVVDDAGDAILEFAGEGTDTVESSVAVTRLSFNVENLTLTGTAYMGIGNDLANVLIGNASSNFLEAQEGDDRLFGGAGNDTLYGNAGNDRLFGGEGTDALHGHSGDDGYILEDGADTIVELEGEGTDTVESSLFTTTLGANVENLTLTSTSYTSMGYGNGLANIMTGNAGSNWLYGGDGGDTLHGASGDDVLEGQNGNDILHGGDGMDEIYGGAGHDVLHGEAGADNMRGGDGNDTLLGGAGNDELKGHGGVNIFDGGDGTDLAEIDVSTSTGTNVLGDTSGGLASYVLSDGTRVKNVEQILYMGGSGVDRVRGGALDDEIEGRNGNDLLFGGAGEDTLRGGEGADLLDGGIGGDSMVGGAGNDTFIVDHIYDYVGEDAGEGTDRVESTISFSLADADNVENLTLTGTGAIDGTGNALGNILTGNGAANTLDGGLGADRMLGGAGNDQYRVDNSGDRVIELAGEGSDTVYASVNYSIAGQHVETLVLEGSGDLRGTGNNLANWLIGNNGNNTLNGGGGADDLIGQGGNDRYIVDHAGDDVKETGEVGIDRVDASISYTLGEHVENLVLTGNSGINGTGNGVANTIVGNNSGNLIDGKGGADLMEGRGGNDRYIVDHAGDKVMELADGGLDVVDASASYSLAGQYVETLRLTGTAAIDATGNNQANSLFGNGAANRISATGGDDKLYGGGGNDVLNGGDGKDRFIFDTALNAATNVDKILDFNVADDSIYLDRSVFGAVASGTLSAGAFVNGGAAMDAADRILYDKASGSIFYDADGSGAGAAILFATVNVGTLLTNADFIGF